MSAGELDQQIILKSVASTNVQGDMTQTPTDVATVFAKVISQRGDESFVAARTDALETIRVKIRARTDVQDTWQLSWNSKIFNIKYVDQTQARQTGYTWLTAEKHG